MQARPKRNCNHAYLNMILQEEMERLQKAKKKGSNVKANLGKREQFTLESGNSDTSVIILKRKTDQSQKLPPKKNLLLAQRKQTEETKSESTKAAPHGQKTPSKDSEPSHNQESRDNNQEFKDSIFRKYHDAFVENIRQKTDFNLQNGDLSCRIINNYGFDLKSPQNDSSNGFLEYMEESKSKVIEFPEIANQELRSFDECFSLKNFSNSFNSTSGICKDAQKPSLLSYFREALSDNLKKPPLGKAVSKDTKKKDSKDSSNHSLQSPQTQEEHQIPANLRDFFTMKLEGSNEKNTAEAAGNENDIYYIVDNQNREMPVRIFDREKVLMLHHAAAVGGGNVKGTPACKIQPENSIDESLRDVLFKAVPFFNDFSTASNNEAVSLQKNNEDVVPKHEQNPDPGCGSVNCHTGTGKKHFIKQKAIQANVKLKRTFGISYIKQPESKQANVSGIYKSVPPLVIQCSTNISPFSKLEPEGADITADVDKMIEGITHCKNGLEVYLMPAVHETCFREFLLSRLNGLEASFRIKSQETSKDKIQNELLGENLVDGPELKVKKLLVPSIDSLGLLLQNNTFVMFEFAFPELFPVNIIIGIHSKKSLNSKQSYLENIGKQNWKKDQSPKMDSIIKDAVKSLSRDDLKDPYASSERIWKSLKDELASFRKELESPDQQESPEDQYLSRIMSCEGINLNTMSLKFEMYVPEQLWKEQSLVQKKKLTTFMHRFKKQFDLMIFKWSQERYLMAQFESKHVTNSEMIQLGISLSSLTNSKPETYEDKIKDITVVSCPASRKSGGIEECPAKIGKQKLTSELMTEVSGSSHSTMMNMMQLPLYTVDTRDSFCYDPIVKETIVDMGGRKVCKKEYYFDLNDLPSNFDHFIKKFPDGRIGAVTYENFFSHEELLEIENYTHQTELEFFRGGFLPQTGQVTLSGKKVKRTKFFFGSRYMWSAQQIAEPHSSLAAGIRTDVSPIPGWIVNKVENPLVSNGIIPPSFINSIALNVYHDGEEGLGQHFDDAIRFRQVSSRPNRSPSLL